MQLMSNCSYLKIIWWHDYDYIMPLSSGYTDYLCPINIYRILTRKVKRKGASKVAPLNH